MITFPDAKKAFDDRAEQRRIEFRRIKKLYMMQMDIHPDPEEDLKLEKSLKISYYDEKNLPPHLDDPNFYFDMP